MNLEFYRCLRLSLEGFTGSTSKLLNSYPLRDTLSLVAMGFSHAWRLINGEHGVEPTAFRKLINEVATKHENANREAKS